MPFLVGTILKTETIEIGFDITRNQEHVFSSTVTSNPIEDGSRITDHIINEPDRLSLKGMMSDTPIRFLSGVRDIAEQGLGGESRSKSTFDTLKALRDTKTLLTIVTSLDTYTNMAIKSFSVPRDNTTGQVLEFSLDLVKIQIVSSKTVAATEDTIKDSPEGTADQGTSTTEAGKQPGVTPNAVTTQKSSFAFDIAKSIGII